MEHPNSKCRIAQAEYLSRLPEEERENKARDIRIGNASYIYHQQAVPIQENRLIMYYKEWLEGLPPNISRHMRMLGFEACKTMIPFTRYVNERNGKQRAYSGIPRNAISSLLIYLILSAPRSVPQGRLNTPNDPFFHPASAGFPAVLRKVPGVFRRWWH